MFILFTGYSLLYAPQGSWFFVCTAAFHPIPLHGKTCLVLRKIVNSVNEMRRYLNARTGLKIFLNTETSPKTIAKGQKTRYGALLHIFSDIFGSNQPILMLFFVLKLIMWSSLFFGTEKKRTQQIVITEFRSNTEKSHPCGCGSIIYQDQKENQCSYVSVWHCQRWLGPQRFP